MKQHFTTLPLNKINRRRFLRTLGVVSASLPLGLSTEVLAKTSNSNIRNHEFLISAQGNDNEHYGLGWIDPSIPFSRNLTSGFRGHGVAQHPHQPERIIMMARRPGQCGIEMTLPNGHLRERFSNQENREFQGHACFSGDGKILFTSEMDATNGEGKIGRRDAETFAWLGEFDSYGIEPHELKLMPDGITLVIANGGLLTDTTDGRTTTNLESMNSSLVYINSLTGELIERHKLAESKASIRHLDVTTDGSVAISMQVQRQALTHQEPIALTAIHRQGQEIVLLDAPETLLLNLQDYIGSVVVHNKERIAAFTSPRGNLALFWHCDTYQLLGYHAFHDVCGITVSHDQRSFILSNSNGELRYIDALTLQEQKQRRLEFNAMRWDNHLLSVALPTEKNS